MSKFSNWLPLQCEIYLWMVSLVSVVGCGSYVQYCLWSECDESSDCVQPLKSPKKWGKEKEQNILDI